MAKRKKTEDATCAGANKDDAKLKEIRSSEEYLQGVSAFIGGDPSTDNPYPMGAKSASGGLNNQRYRWFLGFYDMRVQRLLDKYPTKEDV